jgi:hypothetical protein
MEILQELASSDEQLEWLSRRMLKLYAEWPGPHEMRACFCSKYEPKDGVEADSSVYADGILSEAAESPHVALPPGPAIAATKILEGALALVAKRKGLWPAPKQPPPFPEGVRPITQSDINRALEVRRKRQE